MPFEYVCTFIDCKTSYKNIQKVRKHIKQNRNVNKGYKQKDVALASAH